MQVNPPAVTEFGATPSARPFRWKLIQPSSPLSQLTPLKGHGHFSSQITGTAAPHRYDDTTDPNSSNSGVEVSAE